MFLMMYILPPNLKGQIRPQQQQQMHSVLLKGTSAACGDVLYAQVCWKKTIPNHAVLGKCDEVLQSLDEGLVVSLRPHASVTALMKQLSTEEAPVSYSEPALMPSHPPAT